MSAKITVQFAVPVGYRKGDYCLLYGNDGLGGDVDFDNPLVDSYYDLFPNGAGIYGFGLAPFGHHRFGRGYSMQCDGFGSLPFGRHPFGHGTGIVQADCEVESCGRYKFGVKCFDRLGNPHTDTPVEVDLELHIAPPPVVGLKKNSYIPDSSIIFVEGELTPDATGEYRVEGEYNDHPYRKCVGKSFWHWYGSGNWHISKQLGSIEDPANPGGTIFWYDLMGLMGEYHPEGAASGTATVVPNTINSILVLDVDS